MYDICRFCMNGKDSIQPVNRWTPKDGLGKELAFKISFRGNFFGAPLKMGTYYMKPNIYPTGYDKQGKFTMEGTR